MKNDSIISLYHRHVTRFASFGLRWSSTRTNVYGLLVYAVCPSEAKLSWEYWHCSLLGLCFGTAVPRHTRVTISRADHQHVCQIYITENWTPERGIFCL